MGNFKKIFLVVAILVAAGFLLWGVSWLFQYYQYRSSPEYKAQKYIDEMEKKYREDAYGGSTPEETLNLFIDALKKGDIDLASKYFVIEKQDKIKTDLETGKKNGNIDKFLAIISNKKYIGNQLSSQYYRFTYANGEKVLMSIDLVLNPLSNKWKIDEL